MASLDGLESVGDWKAFCVLGARAFGALPEWPHGSRQASVRVLQYWTCRNFHTNDLSTTDKADAPRQTHPRNRNHNTASPTVFTTTNNAKTGLHQHTLSAHHWCRYRSRTCRPPVRYPLRASCGRGGHEARLLIRPRCPRAPAHAPALPLAAFITAASSCGMSCVEPPL